MKPCKKAEIEFYQTTASHPEFSTYIPAFIGTLTLSANSNPAQAATDLISASKLDYNDLSHLDTSNLANAHQIWAPSNGGKINTDSAIVLENVTARFKKPNVLDVKLGARLWADDAPPAKRAKLDKVAEDSTSKPLGFRIAGMKTWQGKQISEQDGTTLGCYRTYDKDYGRRLNVENIRQGFEDFFFVEVAGISKPIARKVIENFLRELRGLHEVLENEESRMYSASLLFVYEGDGEALQEAFKIEERTIGSEDTSSTDGIGREDDDDADDDDPQLPKTQAVKLIDFAHASWTPGQGRDENLLHGVRNVIRLLDELWKRAAEPTVFDGGTSCG